jgi:outer membrane protein OmpA-like peptidoglycan-associated protein
VRLNGRRSGRPSGRRSARPSGRRSARPRQAQRQAERQAERQAQRQAERQAERQADRQAQQAERQAQRQAERQPAPEEVTRRAREIISDNRRAADLDNQALRQRLNQNREILGTDQLSREQTQALRQQLRADREELRTRMASRQEEEREARPGRSGSDDQTRRSRDRSRDSGDRISDRDVSRIIEERTPSDQLTERELEDRVRVLSRALNAGNITVRQAEVARLLIDRDRAELRRRLHADRDHRRDRRRGGYRDHVVIEFQAGYRPPPVIYAAEAMPRDIQMQLVAPPMYQMQRAYSVREIATNHDVREMMPGIEIDTLNFDFGSAEVRPEEIDKLDEIGMVIENIVAERPDEVFLIEGHTDAVGSHEANDALSQRRAQAVVDALLDYFIIDPENLQTVGLGKRYLKINTPEAEEENRRVTVRRITPLLAGRG